MSAFCGQKYLVVDFSISQIARFREPHTVLFVCFKYSETFWAISVNYQFIKLVVTLELLRKAQHRLARPLATWQILTPGMRPPELRIKGKIPTPR